MWAETAVLPDETELLFIEEDTSSDSAVDDSAAFGVWDLLRMLLVLIMVLVAIYGLVLFLRRRITKKYDAGDSPLQILASRGLGGNKYLHAVRIGKTVLLLGVAESSIDVLSNIDDKETIDELILAHADIKPQTHPFHTLLSKWFRGEDNAKTEKPQKKKSMRSALRAQQHRLRKLQ